MTEIITLSTWLNVLEPSPAKAYMARTLVLMKIA